MVYKTPTSKDLFIPMCLSDSRRCSNLIVQCAFVSQYVQHLFLSVQECMCFGCFASRPSMKIFCFEIEKRNLAVPFLVTTDVTNEISVYFNPFGNSTDF